MSCPVALRRAAEAVGELDPDEVVGELDPDEVVGELDPDEGAVVAGLVPAVEPPDPVPADDTMFTCTGRV
jgi:hypothetical protein